MVEQIQQQQLQQPHLQTPLSSTSTSFDATQFGAEAGVTVSHEKPVLDKILKNVRKEVVNKNIINEKLVEYQIEVREQPIEKRITHEVQEIVIQDEPIIEEEGKLLSDQERQRIHNLMNIKGGERYVDNDGVEVIYAEPEVRQVRRIVRRRIIRPVITEVIEQPIYEIVEQPVEKLAEMRPSTTTIINDQEMYQRLSQRDLSGFVVGPGSVETYVAEPVQYNAVPGSVQRMDTSVPRTRSTGVSDSILSSQSTSISQLPLDQQRNAAALSGDTHPTSTHEGIRVAHMQQSNAAAVQSQSSVKMEERAARLAQLL